MGNDVSRRNFLGGAMASMVVAGKGISAEPVQTRPLGKTRIRVPIIGIGCGTSWYGDSPDEDHALQVLSLAIDQGITYLDTGQGYGGGRSETWMGNIVKDRRDEVLIATKISVRDGDEAMRETDRCLERLHTDHLDIIHIHNLGDEDDLAAIEAKGGLIDVLHKLRDQKITRFIGITSHMHPDTLKTVLGRHDFDVTQMALNAAHQGAYDGETSEPGHSFESIALPVAQRRGIAAIAMKVTGRNQMLEGAPEGTGETLIRYALSLPISHAVVGMSKPEHVRQNAQLARTFKPMPADEMKRISDEMSAIHKANLDRHFAHHIDA